MSAAAGKRPLLWQRLLVHGAERTLASRFGRAAAIASVLLTIVLGSLSFVFSASLLLHQIKQQLTHDAELAAQRMELSLNGLFEQLRGLAATSLVTNALLDSNGRDIYLRPFLADQRMLAPGGDLLLSDFSGHPLVSGHRDTSILPHLNRAQRRLFVEENQLHAALQTDASGHQYLLLGVPVIYPGTRQAEGLLEVSVPLMPLLGNQELVVPSQHRWVFVNQAEQRILGQAPTHGLVLIERSLHLEAPLNALDLRLYLGVNRWSLLSPLGLLLVGYLLIGGLAAWLLARLARRGAHSLAEPLTRLAAQADAITATRCMEVTLDNAHGAEEIVRLASALRRMMSYLRASHDELEQRVAERTRELRASEERWTLALDGNNDGIWDWEPGNGSLFLSARWKSMLGYRDDELPHHYQEWISRMHPEDVERVLNAVTSHLRGETEYYETEHRLRCKDGSYKWILARGRAVRDSSGQPTRMVGSHTDITERKRAEALIQERNIQLNTIFSLSPDGFVSFDSSDRVHFANPAFERLTGLCRAEYLGMSIERLDALLCARATDPRQWPGLMSGCQQSPPQRLNLELRRPHHLVLEIGCMHSDDPQVSRVLYLRDITHQAEVDQMKSEFLSVAAHELRTPMASIYGFTELLLYQTLDQATQRDLLHTIHNQVTLLVDIINELLDLARIEARRGKDFDIIDVDLCGLVQQTLEAFVSDEQGWPLHCQACDEVGMVRGDAAKLRQALTNILGNARKYSPDGDAIEIEFIADQQAGEARVGIVVQDHGIGMTAEQIQRVFERFYRADTSGKVPGSGLGMSIVKEIIDLHGGQVTLQSSLGKGTRVIIWLPRHHPHAPADDAA